MPVRADPAAGGALLFARYAYPPNALGYCGPDSPQELLEHASAGQEDGDLRRLARGFEGAWPYLELIAEANGIGDPLDARVVEAYWVGNALLDHVPAGMTGRSLDDRFRRRAGASWSRLAAEIPDARPHHSFHVFGVYPWLGLLREGRHDEPLRVLDRCRVRWGKVVEVADNHALVLSRPLEWDGRMLREGAPQVEQVLTTAAGLGLAGNLRPGSWCSMHWDWVCESLDARRVAELRRRSAHQLAAVNAQAYSAPASVLS
ncbi:MAG: DUF6390 family protein [Cellulomonas sp.]